MKKKQITRKPGERLENSRHERFCQAYTSTCKGRLKESAIEAGYSAKYGHNTAAKFLKDPLISGRITELEKEAFKKFELTREWIIRRLATIAMHNMADYIKIDEAGLPYYDFGGLTDEKKELIFSGMDSMEVTQVPAGTDVINGEIVNKIAFKTKIKPKDTIRALEVLAKIGGLMDESPQITVPINVITREIVDASND